MFDTPDRNRIAAYERFRREAKRGPVATFALKSRAEVQFINGWRSTWGEAPLEDGGPVTRKEIQIVSSFRKTRPAPAPDVEVPAQFAHAGPATLAAATAAAREYDALSLAGFFRVDPTFTRDPEAHREKYISRQVARELE